MPNSSSLLFLLLRYIGNRLRYESNIGYQLLVPRKKTDPRMEFKMNNFVVLILFCICAGYTKAAKVIVLPQNIKSHVIYHARIAQALAAEGHVVDVILPSNAKIPDCLQGTNVSILWYKVKGNESFVNTREASEMISEVVMSRSMFIQLRQFIELTTAAVKHLDEEFEAFSEDKNIRQHMSSMNYDVAIADTLTMKWHISVLYEMHIPVILFGISPMDWLLRMPVLPSFVPLMMSSLSDSMSFFERLQNTLLSVGNHLLFSLLLSGSVPRTHPPIPVMEVFKRWELYLLLDDASISYPRPVMPNVIYVGDAIPQPGKTLPRELEDFVESAENGIVVVSFGSYFDYLPPQVASKLCSAFKRIPQKVIWKLKDKSLCDADPNKVMIMDWLPQNDLLSHDNVRLFISHCGMNGILESIYHATPIIGFPISIDQPHNAKRLSNLGLGYEMSIRDFSADELRSKISQILSDETILRNVKRSSSMMRNRADTPQKRLSFWIQHVVDNGSKHLRTKAFELNIFQFYCLDVLLVMAFIIILTVMVPLWCIKQMISVIRYSHKVKVQLN